MEIQFYSAVLLLFYFTISPLCFTQEAAEGKAASRKEFFLLDQDYYLNLRQNESGIILKAGNSLLHPDTERYLTAKLKHLLLYGMKKMALSANYTGDTLDKFYLANRKKVKEKMCDIFLKLYHDFAFKGNIFFISNCDFPNCFLCQYNNMWKKLVTHRVKCRKSV